ncbi:hypothetical protein A5724_19555 [Mycobacterium sp. ACS1612]|uniref:hypothetical protein n=1 Tax=Mycobacterium sp. ACS1612 TaxID=1834117 RepID=UPI0007FEA0D2|nr:hypothetical protein [Mycobacterium sp. ACS1612]OBF33267.1 hypothetical protein A5724_19555 [Mycobacterium sp. ACS1612]
MSATLLLCLRLPVDHKSGCAAATVWSKYKTLKAGVTALRACDPYCDPDCQGAHLLAFADEYGHPHVVGSPPPIAQLAELLSEAYPRAPVDCYERWDRAGPPSRGDSGAAHPHSFRGWRLCTP